MIAKIQASRAKEVRTVQYATERRQQILEYMCEKRHESCANLMNEYGISYTTLYRDLQILQCSYPIYTTQGNGGGVHVVEGYYIGRKYLKPYQRALLEQLSATLTGEEAKTMQEILKTFALEIPKKD